MRNPVTALVLGIGIVGIAIGPQAAHGATMVFDAAQDFSAVNNPNGVWQYGYKPAGGAGPFTLFVNSFSASGVDFWFLPSPPPFSTIPLVGHNPTATTAIFGTAIVGPGEIDFHPGTADEDAVVRFTAPVTGTYTIAALFEDRDTFANSADVSVQLGATVLFAQTVFPGNPSVTFSQALSLAAGDVLDFQLDDGSNSFFNDNKRLSVTITTEIPDVVQFAAFNAEVEVKTFRLKSEAEGRFTLGSASNGIHPDTEEVSFQIGSFSGVIPKSSFVSSPLSGSFVFRGLVGGVPVDAGIVPVAATPGTFSFDIEVKDVDVLGTQLSVAVQLTIGDDTGTASAQVERASRGGDRTPR